MLSKNVSQNGSFYFKGDPPPPWGRPWKWLKFKKVVKKGFPLNNIWHVIYRFLTFQSVVQIFDSAPFFLTPCISMCIPTQALNLILQSQYLPTYWLGCNVPSNSWYITIYINKYTYKKRQRKLCFYLSYMKFNQVFVYFWSRFQIESSRN